MDNDSLELSRRALLAGALAGAASLSAFPRAAFASETLTAAVLQFGTVHWLLDVITEHKLDEREGFALKLRMVATNSAGEVALLGQQADLIVADWFWVMRQRSLGGDFLFMPYSAAVGGVVIPKDSAIHSVGDLKGKRVGVAGGPLDKSWLLLRAYGVKEGVGDVGAVAQPVFGAPPLLNEQMLQIKRSMVELNNLIEQLRADNAKLRGQDEQLARDLAEVQRKQKDIVQSVDDRVRKLEPIKVSVDNRNGVLKAGMPVEAEIPFQD